MKPTTSKRPHASSRQPRPPDEPQRPPPFRPPPEARPRVHTNATETYQLHAISIDVAGSAARTRPWVPKQPQQHSARKQQTRPGRQPAELEALPRQTPLSTNARKLTTTRRVPVAGELNTETCAIPTAYVETTPVCPKAQPTDDATPAQTTTTAHVETTPKAQPTDEETATQTTTTAHVETTSVRPKAPTTATTSPLAGTSTRPTPPITAAEKATPASEIPAFLEGLTMTRQHFIKRSKRTLFYRGRRLALQRLEGEQVLVRYGSGRCVLHLYD
ncbi:proteoglycan 4-like isoform X3 [Bactrocera tryoni]|uniref:proteoglycan 4-like isoform X2 n=1 Tax=Bactrocera tryoni TaxID=59916 RepID=UPI001A97CFD1|nr:proteoglycan 4-like isoform X2 [Bactrocera tryoni]XP_039951277.1 proteoglycan 4-like isoform X3 [Bactrocera tryoni]